MNLNAQAPWTEVMGRKEKRSANKAAQGSARTQMAKAARDTTLPAKAKAGPNKPPGGKTTPSAGRVKLEKAPKRAAITLTAPKDGVMTVAKAMAQAKQIIPQSELTKMGIPQVIPKRAATGALVLEIPGPDPGPKADSLAEQLRALLEPQGVRVARSFKRAGLRIKGLEDSISAAEVTAAIAAAGNCRIDEVRAGEIRTLPRGLGSVWVQAPLAAAKKVAAAGHLDLGWTRAEVEALERRPLQCYKCLETGHVREKCKSTIDRGNRCYKCSEEGHRANACPSAKPMCPLCKDLGKPDGHRLGGGKCPASAGVQKGPQGNVSKSAPKST